MKMKYFSLALLIAGAFALTACDDDDKLGTSEVSFNVTLPDIEGLTVNSGTFVFKNVSTGIEERLAYSSTLPTTLVNGLYNVTFTGEGTFPIATEGAIQMRKSVSTGTKTMKEKLINWPVSPWQEKGTKTVEIQGSQENVTIKGREFKLDIELHILDEDATNFVIAEIFGTGTLNPETQTAYNGDRYFRIYNNSDQVIHADGLILLESKFTTTQKFDYTPNLMDSTMTVQVVAMIPGDGTKYPVQPGKSIIICDNAINHTVINPISIDLSQADFEWCASNPDADNPTVPNLNMLYNYTKPIWLLDKQGNRSYAIGRLPKEISTDAYLANYRYTYKYTINNKETSLTEYHFPNKWIVDAVNVSPKNEYVWGVVSASLDLNFTYWGISSTQTENYGNAVVRKVSYTVGDREVLQDTNNSTADFIPVSKATLFK